MNKNKLISFRILSIIMAFVVFTIINIYAFSVVYADFLEMLGNALLNLWLVGLLLISLMYVQSKLKSPYHIFFKACESLKILDRQLNKNSYLVLNKNLQIIYINDKAIKSFKHHQQEIKKTIGIFDLDELHNCSFDFKLLSPKPNFQISADSLIKPLPTSYRFKYDSVYLCFSTKPIKLLNFHIGTLVYLNFKNTIKTADTASAELIESLKMKIINLMIKDALVPNRTEYINLYTHINRLLTLQNQKRTELEVF